MRRNRSAASAGWIGAVALILSGLRAACPQPAWSQPAFSPATLIYKTTVRFPPGSAHLSRTGVRTLQDVVRRTKDVQLPRIRVAVDGGDEVWHVSSSRVRKSQAEAVERELRRAGLKEIPIDLEGIGPNQEGSVPKGRRARAVQRATAVSIWDIRGG